VGRTPSVCVTASIAMVLSCSRTVLPGLLALLLLGTSACDNTIQPYSEQATYSIWGYLSLDRKLQFVRVKPLDQTLTRDTSDLSELTVTLENLSTNETGRLRDSIVFFEDEESRIPTQNYWTERPIDPQTTYRLTVTDSTGTTIQARTTTPVRVTPSVAPDTGNCLTEFTVEFPGVKQKRRITNFSVKFNVSGEPFVASQERQGVIDLQNPDASPEHDNVFLTFQPESLLQLRFEEVDDPETPCVYESLCPNLAPPPPPDDSPNLPPSGGPGPSGSGPPKPEPMFAFYFHLGPDWYGTPPEQAVYDNPIVTQRVTNGRGFFGALQRGRIQVSVDTLGSIPVDGMGCS
jgi:hypothetical protein